jgi:hypothetical protein
MVHKIGLDSIPDSSLECGQFMTVRQLSLSPRGTSGERAGERGKFRMQK